MDRHSAAGSATTHHRLGWRDALLCVIAGVLVWIVYTSALHNSFVYDDYRMIIENASIHDVSDLRAIVLHEVTRPLVNLSFAVDHAIWGSQPFGFHLTNVVLHCVNVVLLFFMASRLASERARDDGNSPRLIAFVAASVFAVHPLMTGAVGYISARSEVLCATLLFLAFLSAQRWIRQGGGTWWLLTLALWVAAVLTRELAAVLPIVLFAYDRLFIDDGQPGKRHRWWRLHAPLIGLSAAAAVIRLAVFAYVEHPDETVLLWSAILDQAIVSWRYAALFVNPSGQAIYHEVRPVLSMWDPRGLLALCAVAFVVTMAWYARRVDRLARFGIIWFFLLLVPSSFLSVLGSGDGMQEHRVYVAGCGLFLIVGSTIGWLMAFLSRTRLTRGLVHAVIVVGLLWLGGRAVVRNLMWGDPVALWREASLLAPNDGIPQTALAQELERGGRYEEAVEAFKKALHLRPKAPLAYLNLGVCLAVLQRFDEATATFEQLRSIEAQSTIVSTGLGAVAMLSGQRAQARAHFLEALQRDPSDILTLQWLALLEEEAGDAEAALRRCEEIQSLSPRKHSNEDCIRRNRARLASRTGQP